MFRKTILFSILSLCFISCDYFKPKPQTETTLQKACTFLWSKQSDNGAWQSETHGIMKGGESLTAFILWTLLEVPDTAYRKPKRKIEKGLNFIRKHLNSNGVLGLSDEYVMDYPNYATSYALRVLLKYGEKKDELLITKMKNYLINQQFSEQRGIQPTHLAYGAWGFGEKLEKGKFGHVDLSHTRRVLQALKMAGGTADSFFLKARNFLSLLQKHPSEERAQPTDFHADSLPYDGGFYSSSVILGVNKGGILKENGSEYLASYATTTCDGLLSLLACGYSKKDEPVQAAYSWLTNHPKLDSPQGMDKNNSVQWHLVMVFYHLAARAEAYKAVGHEGIWREEIEKIIVKKQLENGSFSNPNGAPNKEDDPLLATALAIIALSN